MLKFVSVFLLRIMLFHSSGVYLLAVGTPVVSVELFSCMGSLKFSGKVLNQIFMLVAGLYAGPVKFGAL